MAPDRSVAKLSTDLGHRSGRSANVRRGGTEPSGIWISTKTSSVEEEEEEEEEDADARDKAAAKKTKAAGRGRQRGRAGAGGDDKEKNKAKAAFVRQNQKNDVRGGGGDGTVMGDGLVHYAGDVYVQSTQRPGGTHHDLAFALFLKDKTSYALKDCDATGKYSKGKDQAILSSKIAVGRYLEREGLSEEEVEKRENALKEAKAKAEAEAK